MATDSSTQGTQSQVNAGRGVQYDYSITGAQPLQYSSSGAYTGPKVIYPSGYGPSDAIDISGLAEGTILPDTYYFPQGTVLPSWLKSSASAGGNNYVVGNPPAPTAYTPPATTIPTTSSSTSASTLPPNAYRPYSINSPGLSGIQNSFTQPLSFDYLEDAYRRMFST